MALEKWIIYVYKLPSCKKGKRGIRQYFTIIATAITSL